MADVEILSIRHGRTRFNAESRFVGRSDPPLDEVGRSQARDLARWLGHPPVDAVWTSPMRRARETASGLAPSPALSSDLRELDQGALEGLQAAEAMRRYPAFFEAWRRDPGAVVVPGGEGLAQARRRGLAALEAIARGAPPGARVVAISHQLLLASVAATLDGAALAAWTDYRVDHAEGWCMAWDGERLRLQGRLKPRAERAPIR